MRRLATRRIDDTDRSLLFAEKALEPVRDVPEERGAVHVTEHEHELWQRKAGRENSGVREVHVPRTWKFVGRAAGPIGVTKGSPFRINCVTARQNQDGLIEAFDRFAKKCAVQNGRTRKPTVALQDVNGDGTAERMAKDADLIEAQVILEERVIGELIERKRGVARPCVDVFLRFREAVDEGVKFASIDLVPIGKDDRGGVPGGTTAA